MKKNYLLIFLFFTLISVAQGNYTVTSLSDDGSSGTLRYGIQNTTASTIDFDSGLTGTVTLTSNLPGITRNISIIGNGVNNLTMSGANSYNMFQVSGGAVLTISGITFTNNASSNGSIFRADNSNSSVIATSINVTANNRSYAFYTNNPSTITISNSTFASNSGTLFGSDYGSTPTTTSDTETDYSNRITVTGSTFSSNTGIIFYTERYVKIDNCVFTGNTQQIGTFRGVNRYQVLNSTFTNNTGGTLFSFYSWIGDGTKFGESTLSTNNTLFNGNTFTGNTGIVINPGGNSYYDNKTTISNNTFINNGTNWSGSPIVVSGNYSPANLSNFNNRTKTFYDGTYTITPPNSSSTGAFTFDSSNTNVATISGTTVTIVGAGVSTITATQASDTKYDGASISALLTVNAVSVLTKNGKITTIDPNYVDKYGAKDSSFGLSPNGVLKTAKSIFDIGNSYGGGIIAYVFQSGDPGYVAGETHGIIMATSDQSSSTRWYNNTFISTTATGTAIGTGSVNTTKIITNQGDTGSYAAKLCKDYRGGSYSDWFLPSKDELNKIFINKTIIGGGLGTSTYWSSTENTSTSAYTQSFSAGTQSSRIKSSLLAVRAIRNF